MLFVMGCNLPIGARMSLHFFEPRYRWMCRRLFAGEPPYMCLECKTSKVVRSLGRLEHPQNSKSTFKGSDS